MFDTIKTIDDVAYIPLNTNGYYVNAQLAFESYYDKINRLGHIKDNTKFLRNVGFYLVRPMENTINTKWRKWKKSYAEKEWEWYCSKDRSVEKLKQFAPLWDKMHNGDNIVNSNYGWQWNRNNQLLHVVELLIKEPTTRRAVLSIYDGKEHEEHKYDTPCTVYIMFTIDGGYLNMSVHMRSNDLWFGFCNDQYCFSKLHERVANMIKRPIGWYYHFANDLHLYDNFLNRDKIITVNDLYKS